MNLNAVFSSWEQNSYVDKAYADAYFSRHSERQSWSDLDSTVHEGALMQASALLDGCPLFAAEAPLFAKAPVAQAMKLPLARHLSVSGTAESGYNSALLDSALADSSRYRSDSFTGGAVRIRLGTNAYTIREITALDLGTGRLSVTPEWDVPPDTTSAYTLVVPLSSRFRNAVCEFALEIAQGGFGAVQELIASGASVPRVVSLIPLKVRQMIPSYFSHDIEIEV